MFLMKLKEKRRSERIDNIVWNFYLSFLLRGFCLILFMQTNDWKVILIKKLKYNK